MEKQERFYFDVWIALLSTLAGMVNVVTLLLFFTPTTHFMEILRNLFCPSMKKNGGQYSIY